MSDDLIIESAGGKTAPLQPWTVAAISLLMFFLAVAGYVGSVISDQRALENRLTRNEVLIDNITEKLSRIEDKLDRVIEATNNANN